MRIVAQDGQLTGQVQTVFKSPLGSETQGLFSVHAASFSDSQCKCPASHCWALSLSSASKHYAIVSPAEVFGEEECDRLEERWNR